MTELLEIVAMKGLASATAASSSGPADSRGTASSAAGAVPNAASPAAGHAVPGLAAITATDSERGRGKRVAGKQSAADPGEEQDDESVTGLTDDPEAEH